MKAKQHLNKTGRTRRQQLGQSMVEYTVVIVFGILVLSGSPKTSDVVASLMDTINRNYKGYSFALSISDYPDYETASEYWGKLGGQGVNEDMKDVLTDNINTASTRDSTKYTTAIEKYSTSPPVSPESTVLTKGGELKNLSIP